MSDERLRQLERRWHETGTTEDEAAFLLERVRVGDLQRARLELAARLGNPGAAAATGIHRVGGGIPQLISELGKLGKEPLAHAAAAAAQAVWSEWRWDRDERLAAALDAAEAWIACPCPTHAATARSSCEAATWARAEYEDPSAPGHGANAICWISALAWRAGESAVDGVERDARRTLDAASHLLGERLGAIIGARLIKWALQPADDGSVA